MEVIFNTICDINSAILIEQNGKVRHSSSLTELVQYQNSSAIVGYCKVK